MYISVACGIQIQLVLDLINNVLVHEFAISAPISRQSQMVRQRSKFKLGWFLTSVTMHGVMEDSHWPWIDRRQSLECMTEDRHWRDGGQLLEWYMIATGMTHDLQGHRIFQWLASKVRWPYEKFSLACIHDIVWVIFSGCIRAYTSGKV